MSFSWVCKWCPSVADRWKSHFITISSTGTDWEIGFSLQAYAPAFAESVHLVLNPFMEQRFLHEFVRPPVALQNLLILPISTCLKFHVGFVVSVIVGLVLSHQLITLFRHYCMDFVLLDWLDRSVGIVPFGGPVRVLSYLCPVGVHVVLQNSLTNSYDKIQIASYALSMRILNYAKTRLFNFLNRPVREDAFFFSIRE